jgi:hypothetical protein
MARIPWKLRAIAAAIAACGLAAAQSGSSQQPGLAQAVQSGNVDAVRTLLAGGADPNVRDAQGTTALMLAARKEDLAMIKLLLQAGARSFWRDVEGKPAYEQPGLSTPVRTVLKEAFLLDQPDLENLASAVTVQSPITVLVECVRQMPTRGDREWKSLLKQLTRAAMWLRARPWDYDRLPEDYKRSLTLTIYALDKAARTKSKPLLRAVALDIQLKRDDCAARGPNSAGDDVAFRVLTVDFPKASAPGWIVRFRHVLDFRPGDWERFQTPTDAVRRLPPGPYRMYVESPDRALKSCVENVAVTYRGDHFVFVIPKGSQPNCK